MIIVSGTLEVDEAERAAYLDGCRPVIEAAREAPGCQAFYLVADPLEPAVIRVYEQWGSVADVEAFRGDGPSGEQQATIRRAEVVQHEVASSTPL